MDAASLLTGLLLGALLATAVTLGVVGGILVMVFVVYPILLFVVTRSNPFLVLSRIKEAMITALMTRRLPSSDQSTRPTRSALSVEWIRAATTEVSSSKPALEAIAVTVRDTSFMLR